MEKALKGLQLFFRKKACNYSINVLNNHRAKYNDASII